MNSTGRGSTDRVSINKGDTWIVRFLHPRMGKNKDRWFARVAQHWLNKKPITCPTYTAQWLGGDPEAICPVCEAAGILDADRDDNVSKFGWRLKVQLKWITYCLVWEKDMRGNTELIDIPEALNVHEFAHYRTTFDELFGFVRSYRKVPLGIFDYDKGCDFSVTRTGKGLRLDRLDPMPILADFELDDAVFDKYIKRIESQLKAPVVKIPTEEQLDDFAAKAYDEIDNMSGRGGSRRRSRSRDDDDDDGDEPRGRSRRSSRSDDDDGDDAPRGRSRRASRDDDGDEAKEEAPRSRRASRESEDEEPPARSGRRRASEDDGDEAPRGRSRRASRESSEDDAESEEREERSGNRRRERSEATEPEDDVPYDDPKPAAKAPANSEQEEEEDLPPTDREGRKASTRERKPFAETKGRAGRSSALDEDEEIPEEDKDLAPPINDGDAEDEPKNGADNEGGVSSRIRSRVSRVSRRDA